MSQTTTPVSGQIEKPNPFELFWEKNKIFVIAVAFAAVAAIAINYLLAYQEKRAQAERWSGFAEATALRTGYSETRDTSQLEIIKNPQFQQYSSMFVSAYYQATREELLSKLPEDIERIEIAELERRIAAAKDEPTAPLMLWVLAMRHAVNDDYDQALAALDRLEEGFPEHFLCVESDFPVQWRDEVEEDEPEEDETDASQREEPKEYVLPQKGSSVSLLRAGIEARRAFQSTHARFFKPPETGPKRATVTIEGPNSEEYKLVIGLYEEEAPEHVAAFERLVEEEFWNGMRVHLVKRERTNQGRTPAPSEFRFGWTSTKDEDDRSKWVNAEPDEANVLDWESSRLSHFPGTLSAIAHTDGKSQIEVLAINADDVAASEDGQRVIFGRVLSGLESVDAIVNDAQFESQADLDAGQGKPLEYYTIKSITIE